MHLFMFAALLLLFVPTRAQDQTVADAEPPVANRVEPFSGAVGRKFTVSMTAQPTELRTGDVLSLTVQVTAEGPWQKPPARPDLRRHEKYARFARSFHIENAEERQVSQDVWEFVYRLRPLHDEVSAVPRLPFVYYRPGQGYQTLGAPAVKLSVRPRAEVSAAEVQGAGEIGPVADQLLELVEGPAVLRRDSATTLPGPGLLALVLAAPPVLCACWYLAWRHLYPEAARLARQRRSRAARAALHGLRRVDRTRLAEQSAATLAEYLRQRFDLPAAEPTPAEVSGHLDRVGVPADVRAAATDFFRACDAARFAAGVSERAEDWAMQAEAIILKLEAAPCTPERC